MYVFTWAGRNHIGACNDGPSRQIGHAQDIDRGRACHCACPAFTRSTDPVPRAGTPAATPGFTLSVVHQFPAALVTTPKYLALSKDGNLYGATSAVGLSNGTVFRLSGGSVYTRLATLDYARDGGPFGAPFLGTGGWCHRRRRDLQAHTAALTGRLGQSSQRTTIRPLAPGNGMDSASAAAASRSAGDSGRHG
jgi:hypothetical protein